MSNDYHHDHSIQNSNGLQLYIYPFTNEADSGGQNEPQCKFILTNLKSFGSNFKCIVCIRGNLIKLPDCPTAV